MAMITKICYIFLIVINIITIMIVVNLLEKDSNFRMNLIIIKIKGIFPLFL